MSIQTLKKPRNWLLSTVLILILAGVFIPRTVFARIMPNTILPVGIVADRGRAVVVTGVIGFPAGETARMRVTVTQRDTGALAEGEILLSGTGTTSQWEVTTPVVGRANFVPGPATAVAVARTTLNGQPTDAHQWLVEITLVQE